MENQILRLHEVVHKTSLSSSSIQRGVKADTFPKPVKISERAVGWRLSDIEAWIDALSQGGTDIERLNTTGPKAEEEASDV